MPHRAEGRREPKPWAAGLLKFSIILFAMIPLYFFMGGFFTPYMATGAAREIVVCMPDVLLVLLVLTLVALGSLGGGLRKGLAWPGGRRAHSCCHVAYTP